MRPPKLPLAKMICLRRLVIPLSIPSFLAPIPLIAPLPKLKRAIIIKNGSLSKKELFENHIIIEQAALQPPFCLPVFAECTKDKER